MEETLQPVFELCQTLLRLPRRHATLLVGIDGRGGSGKSTLSKAIAARIPGTTVVEFDDFYRPSEQRQAHRASSPDEVGCDFDWRRVREQVLVPLAADQQAGYQRYDWNGDRLAEWHLVQPGSVVIVEGNYSTRPELRDFYDVTIWVEAPHEIRLQRGLARDGEHARARWLEEWMPEEERYITTENPRRWADVVVDSSGSAVGCTGFRIIRQPSENST